MKFNFSTFGNVGTGDKWHYYETGFVVGDSCEELAQMRCALPVRFTEIFYPHETPPAGQKPPAS